MKVFAGLSVAALLVANSPLALAAPTGLNTRNELSNVHDHTEPIGLQGPTHHHRRDLLGGLLGGLIPGAGLLGGLLPGAAPAQPAAGAAPTTPAAGGDGGLLGGLFGLVTNGPLAGITDSLKNTLVDTFL